MAPLGRHAPSVCPALRAAPVLGPLWTRPSNFPTAPPLRVPMQALLEAVLELLVQRPVELVDSPRIELRSAPSECAASVRPRGTLRWGRKRPASFIRLPCPDVRVRLAFHLNEVDFPSTVQPSTRRPFPIPPPTLPCLPHRQLRTTAHLSTSITHNLGTHDGP